MAAPRVADDDLTELVARRLRATGGVVVLPDRHLPDLLAADPLTWEWPYACHRHGHVWEVGAMFCSQCGAAWLAWGDHGHLMEETPFTQRPLTETEDGWSWRRPEVATAVTRSDGHVVLVAIPPDPVVELGASRYPPPRGRE